MNELFELKDLITLEGLILDEIQATTDGNRDYSVEELLNLVHLFDKIKYIKECRETREKLTEVK